MKIIFCISDYRIFTERCIPLAQSLQSVGHELYCVTPTGIDAEIVPTTQCDWPNFDMDVIEKIHPDLIIVWNGYFNHTLAAVRWLKRRYKVITMEMGWFHRASHSYLATDLAQVSAIAEVPYVPGVAAKEHYQLELEEVKEVWYRTTRGLGTPQSIHIYTHAAGTRYSDCIHLERLQDDEFCYRIRKEEGSSGPHTCKEPPSSVTSGQAWQRN